MSLQPSTRWGVPQVNASKGFYLTIQLGLGRKFHFLGKKSKMGICNKLSKFLSMKYITLTRSDCCQLKQSHKQAKDFSVCSMESNKEERVTNNFSSGQSELGLNWPLRTLLNN